MSNEMVYVREMPTLEFIMSEMMQHKAQAKLPENERIGRLFHLLAALQILTIAGGAVLGLFVAPASLFASRTDGEAFGWIAAALVGFLSIALGVITLPLAAVAANGFRREKKWGKAVGIIAAGLTLLEFPFGTVLGSYLLWKIFSKSSQKDL